MLELVDIDLSIFWQEWGVLDAAKQDDAFDSGLIYTMGNQIGVCFVS